MKILGFFMILLGSLILWLSATNPVAVGLVPSGISELLLTITSVSLAMTGTFITILGSLILTDAKEEKE